MKVFEYYFEVEWSKNSLMQFLASVPSDSYGLIIKSGTVAYIHVIGEEVMDI